MILALLLIAVAGALTAGWIAVVTARSAMTEQMTAASQRRIALENSKALTRKVSSKMTMSNWQSLNQGATWRR